MHSEVEELRPKLKEILYDCAVDIKATRAALYLYDGDRHFELVTEYGFRGTAREGADFNDPIVDRCGRGRTPFFVNGVGTEPRFSRLLYDASTDRLLAAPLYSRGKLIGFIDLRDKAGKALFENEDVTKAQRIADRLVDLFAEKNIFGHRFIALSTADEAHAHAPAPAPAPAPVAAPPPAAAAATAVAPPPPRVTEARTEVPRLATLVIEARDVASRLATGTMPELLSEKEITATRDALRSILLIPGSVAALFSAFGHLGGVQELVARSSIHEDAKSLIQSKLNVWLTKRGEPGGFVRTAVSTPFGTTSAPITMADVQKVFTAPLHVGSLRGLYLTVVFAGNPDRAAHELLAALHTHVQLVIEQSIQRNTLATTQAHIAAKLVEPDFTKFPELRRHSELVSRLCESFARYLGLSASEVEQARIAGLVHDCGMRLLEYARLYRKRDLTSEELAFLREHPNVGAAMAEPLLGPEIARIILCHHERVDGRGYPNELHGNEIPYLSRLIQVCDAWVTMTDPDTYQVPESRDSALATLSRAASAQFDAELAARFIDMMRSSR